jgi:hypothetical protein
MNALSCPGWKRVANLCALDSPPTSRSFKVAHQVDAAGSTLRTACSHTNCTRRANLLFQRGKGEWHNGCIALIRTTIHESNAVFFNKR